MLLHELIDQLVKIESIYGGNVKVVRTDNSGGRENIYGITTEAIIDNFNKDADGNRLEFNAIVLGDEP